MLVKLIPRIVMIELHVHGISIIIFKIPDMQVFHNSIIPV